jgi:hypothetical protein
MEIGIRVFYMAGGTSESRWNSAAVSARALSLTTAERRRQAWRETYSQHFQVSSSNFVRITNLFVRTTLFRSPLCRRWLSQISSKAQY